MDTGGDFLLATNDTSDAVMVSGVVDIWIIGLSAGSVKMQVSFKDSDESQEDTWMDVPDAEWSTDITKTLYITEDQVNIRFVGTSNTDGVYIRVGR